MSASIVKLYSAECQEVAGEIVSAVVTYDVEVNYRGESPEKILEIALTHPNLPAIGDGFTSSENNQYLAAARRNAKIIKPAGIDGKVAVLIAVEYELWRFRDGRFEEMATTLEQIETMRDRDGTPITVTYGRSSTNPGCTRPVHLDVPIHKTVFSEIVVIETSDVKTLVGSLVNHVNSSTFRGEDAGCILCSGIRATPKNRNLAAGAELWELDATFEIKRPLTTTEGRGGWTYTAAFKEPDGTYPDPNPPATIQVKWHPEADFSLYFGIDG